MSYATVQAAVSTVIKKVAGYDGTNVKEEDYRAIAIGKLKFVVLSRGDSDREYISMGNPVTVINTWTVIATLFVPWTTARGAVRLWFHVIAKALAQNVSSRVGSEEIEQFFQALVMFL